MPRAFHLRQARGVPMVGWPLLPYGELAEDAVFYRSGSEKLLLLSDFKRANIASLDSCPDVSTTNCQRKHFARALKFFVLVHVGLKQG